MMLRGMPSMAKHGDGQARHGRYQRLAVVMWVGMACPMSHFMRYELARARM